MALSRAAGARWGSLRGWPKSQPRSPRGRCHRRDQRPAVLDVGDGNAEPFDGADDLAVEIAVAIHMGRRDEELGLVPLRLEVPAQLRERDGLLELEPFAAHGDRIDTRWSALIGGLGASRI